jgi:hypothetical protein
VGTLADVTAEAGAEAAISEAKDAATEASQLKSDFLANMSHLGQVCDGGLRSERTRLVNPIADGEGSLGSLDLIERPG